MLMPVNTINPTSNNKYLDSDGYTNNPVSIVDTVHSNANAIQAVYLAILPIGVLGMDIILSNFLFYLCIHRFPICEAIVNRVSAMVKK